MQHLTFSRLENLNRITLEYLRNFEWEFPRPNQQERSLTNHTVGPSMENLLLKLGERQLVIRYDGKLNPRSMMRHGMNFLPDLEVYLYSQKCIALEVKILRDNDASGSLSKAIGQTFMYKALGFEIAIGLIFDARTKSRAGLQETLDELVSSETRVNFIVI